MSQASWRLEAPPAWQALAGDQAIVDGAPARDKLAQRTLRHFLRCRCRALLRDLNFWTCTCSTSRECVGCARRW